MARVLVNELRALVERDVEEGALLEVYHQLCGRQPLAKGDVVALPSWLESPR